MTWMRVFRFGKKFTITLGGIKPYMHFRKYREADPHRAFRQFERFLGPGVSDNWHGDTHRGSGPC